MNLTEFTMQFQNLSDYFCKKITDGQATQYYNSLKYIPARDFKFAVESIIENGKPMQSNFPTIGDVKSYCPFKRSVFDYNPPESEQDYYARVEVGHLLEALEVLKRSEEAFLKFCNDRYFSNNDISRVKVKYHMLNKQDKVKTNINELTENIG